MRTASFQAEAAAVSTEAEGAALAAGVRRRVPGLPVLSSGRSERPEGEHVWLQKPYDVPGLREAVGKALGPAEA